MAAIRPGRGKSGEPIQSKGELRRTLVARGFAEPVRIHCALMLHVFHLSAEE
jgi:hypothetical protein